MSLLQGVLKIRSLQLHTEIQLTENLTISKSRVHQNYFCKVNRTFFESTLIMQSGSSNWILLIGKNHVLQTHHAHARGCVVFFSLPAIVVSHFMNLCPRELPRCTYLDLRMLPQNSTSLSGWAFPLHSWV